VIRAARWQIPTLVLIRRPKDAVLSFAIRDPISVDQALKYYLSFVNEVFARIEKNSRKRYGETHWETNVSRPSAAKERMKHEVGYDLENPKRKKLIAEAEAVYDRLTSPVRKPASDT
jgi:hypothetical protein